MFGDVVKLLVKLIRGRPISEYLIVAYITAYDLYMTDELFYKPFTEWNELFNWFVNSPVCLANKSYIV